MKSGKVFFVGAGPGDPKLITVKGIEAIRRADVILHDRLAHFQLLHYSKSDTQLIYCGKEPGNHSVTQEEINRILIRHAKQGKVVVRIKGGSQHLRPGWGRGRSLCTQRHSFRHHTRHHLGNSGCYVCRNSADPP